MITIRSPYPVPTLTNRHIEPAGSPDVGATRLMLSSETLHRLGFWCDAAIGAALVFVLL